MEQVTALRSNALAGYTIREPQTQYFFLEKCKETQSMYETSIWIKRKLAVGNKKEKIEQYEFGLNQISDNFFNWCNSS